MAPVELEDVPLGEVFEHAFMPWDGRLVRQLNNWSTLLSDLMNRHRELSCLDYIDFRQEDWQKIRVLAVQGCDVDPEDKPDYATASTSNLGLVFAHDLARNGFAITSDDRVDVLPEKLEHRLYRATWRWRPPRDGYYSGDSSIQLITMLGTELNHGDDELYSRPIPFGELKQHIGLVDQATLPTRDGDITAELPVRRLDRRTGNAKPIRSASARRRGEQ